MKQRIKLTAVLIVLLFLLTAYSSKIDQTNKDAESLQYIETQKTEGLSIQKKLELTFKEEEKKQIAQILNHKQSEYRKMPYSGDIVSSELVSRLEEALYSYCKFGEDRSDQPYQELLKELGGGSFKMTKEEIQKTFSENLPDEVFTFLLNNKKRLYLKIYFLENSGAECYLWSKGEEEWFFKGDFKTMFTRGEVICHEGIYYYIGLEPAREEDGEKRENGIRIFRLDEQMEWENNLLIRYLPEEYERVTLFTAAEEADGEAVNHIADKLAPASVLKNPADTCGETEEIIEIVTKDDVARVRKFSRADMMNTGIPIYMKKASEWSPQYNWTHLAVDFYLYDETEEKFVLLDNENESRSGEVRREYLWCEEIGGKVYTFQLFRLEEYTYIAEVLLLEGDKKTILQREVWVPLREMKFEEGEKHSPVM